MRSSFPWRIIFILLLCSAWPALAAERAAAIGGHLTLAGSTTMTPLMSEIAQRFQKLHPAVQIEVRQGGSGRGVSALRSGDADIGMVSRTLLDSERDLYATSIARDGVALIVHKDNPVQALSDQQLRDIYRGKLNNWRQLGGRDASLHALAASAVGGSTELITQYLQLPSDQIVAARRIDPNAERMAAIVADPNAIIWLSLGEAERSAAAGKAIKMLTVGGVVASSRNLRNGAYPIARPLNLVTRQAPSGLASSFIAFCVSSQITDLVQAFGFVPYLD